MATKKEYILGYFAVRDNNETIFTEYSNEIDFVYYSNEPEARQSIYDGVSSDPKIPEIYGEESFSVYKLVRVSRYEVETPKQFNLKKIG